jgi:pyruvate dehydrogenase E1 component alpha subunit
MDDEFLLEGLRLMHLSRAVDRRATAMQRQGRWGVYSPATGQEAAIVGSAMALDPARDWIVPQYRELAAVVHHGMPLDRIVAAYVGKVSAASIPDGVNVLPTQVALAAQLPQAAGLAWGLRLQRRDGVVLAYVGEGGSSEGDFHEACNLAGVTRAPVVFLLQNNQWAISTPRRRQSAAPTLAARAPGYGFPGAFVDGNDLLAVHAVTRQAVERARAGEGPTLIEALTYRMSFHNTTDNPERYVEREELEAAARRDPLARVERFLAEAGMLDDVRRSELVASVESDLSDAIDRALAYPANRPGDLFDGIYARPPKRLQRQRAELPPA